MSNSSPKELITVLTADSGWALFDLKELKQYRDLFYFLVWRDIKVLYAQTVLGFAWAILNPAVQIVVFSVIFGRVANLDTGGVPYVLFSTVAIIPWTYMSDAMTAASQSLVQGKQLLGKIYFPRVLFPLTPILAKLVDFSISLVILILVMIYYQVTPTWNLLLIPPLVLAMMLVPTGIGMWLAALAIRYRDVKFAMTYMIKLLIYSAPILYSASSIPENLRFWYSLNPIVAVIEGFRACLLGGPIEWQFIVPGLVTAVLLFLSGALYFRRMERVFVDVI
ncbi:MAG: ABC transporter permease [Gammaproteobacteria bacterium]|nr:ABC transporter permease [Gammaproteobacteria bacterium]